MKVFTKKSILQKTIISLLVILITINFITPTYSNAGTAADIGGVLLSPIMDLICSVGDVIINVLQRCMMGDWGNDSPNFSLNAFLLEATAYFNADDYAEPSIDEKKDVVETINPDEEFTKGWLWNAGEYYIPVATYSPEQIFTGNVAGLDINFIKPNKYQDSDGNKVESSAEKLQSTIASWYVALRNLAVVGLLSVLVYVGIRILISSTANDKAKYKQMFTDWLIALCLLFFLHYIMSFVITLTESICTAIGGNGQSTYIIKDETQEKSFATNLLGAARYKTQYKDIGQKLTYVIIYIFLVGYTVMFTWVYLKRLLMMAFLTLMAPLVALTYPIDKISDGKAQAFDTWLKEYIFNALLQPFHLIIYIVLVGSAMDLATSNPIYAIAAMAFVLSAEKILRNFFGFNKAGAGTLGALTGFTAGSLATKLLGGKGGKSGGTGGKSGAEGEKPVRFDANKHDVGQIEDGNSGNIRQADGNDGEDNSINTFPDQDMQDYYNNPDGQQSLDNRINQLEEEDWNYQGNPEWIALNEQRERQQAEEQARQQAEAQRRTQQQTQQEEQQTPGRGRRFASGMKNLARAHNINGGRVIKGAAKFATRTAFTLAGGTIGAIGGVASGQGVAGMLTGATAGTSVGGRLGNSAIRIPGRVAGAGRTAANAVRREVDIFNGNTNMQDVAKRRAWKNDENHIQYVKDMMTKENGVIPSNTEVKERMNSFDPYLAEGLTDIKDMLKAQKAEQYVTSKQSAIIAAIGKEKGIDADILNDDKKLNARMNNMKQEFINKGKSETEASRLTEHTFNVLKAQNGVAHNLTKPANDNNARTTNNRRNNRRS